MKNRLSFIVYWFLAVLPLGVSLIAWPFLPEEVAIHWNADGEVNGTAGRTMVALGLPLLLLAVTVILNVAIRFDPKYQSMMASPALPQVGRWSVILLGLLAQGFTLWAALTKGGGAAAEMRDGVFWIPLAVGLLIMIIGNYLPKCRQSYTVGIKLPWTLADEDNWKHTHRFAGYVWIMGGALLMLNAFLRQPWLEIGSIVLLAAAPCGYSFLWYRRHGRKPPTQGSCPSGKPYHQKEDKSC